MDTCKPERSAKCVGIGVLRNPSLGWNPKAGRCEENDRLVGDSKSLLQSASDVWNWFVIETVAAC